MTENRIVQNWNDVDAAIEEMGLLDIEIGVATASLAERLHNAFAQYAPEIVRLKADRQAIENIVNGFCLTRKQEFAKRRSRVLTFGKVAFKVSEKITYPEDMESVIISVLRRLGHVDCINVKESIDKSAVKNLDDNELARCGLKRIKEDNFRIEPNTQAIAKKIGADCKPAGSKIDVEKLAKLIGTKEDAACA